LYSGYAIGWTTEKLWFDSGRGRRYFSSPKHPYRLWCLPLNGYWGSFPRG